MEKNDISSNIDVSTLQKRQITFLRITSSKGNQTKKINHKIIR